MIKYQRKLTIIFIENRRIGLKQEKTFSLLNYMDYKV